MTVSSPVRVAVGILKRAHEVLVAKRPPHKPYSGYWEFPGGKIEPNESSLAALKRELKEELNIDVQEAHLWVEHHHTYPDKTVLLEMWLIEDFVGVPTAVEHEALQWASIPEIAKLKVLDGNWPILEKLKMMLP